MKKTVLSTVLIFTIGLLTYLGYRVIVMTKQKNDIALHLQTIPTFEFLTIKQQPFANQNLEPNIHTIFIYFNSECEFCQHEAQSISENLAQFDDVQFVFVSAEAITVIEKFSETYNLNNKQNIIFLHDNLDIFSSRFDATSIPYLLIYDKNQKLIKKHKGQLNAKGLLRVLNQND